MCNRVITLMCNEGGRKFNQEFAGVTFCDPNQIAFHYRKFERSTGTHCLQPPSTDRTGTPVQHITQPKRVRPWGDSPETGRKRDQITGVVQKSSGQGEAHEAAGSTRNYILACVIPFSTVLVTK